MEDLLKQAIAAHQGGNLNEALDCLESRGPAEDFRKALALDRNNCNGGQNLGALVSR